MKNLTYLLFLPLMILSSCTKDETCQNQYSLEKDVLSLTAEQYNPYPSDFSRVIFRDSADQEYSFSILDNITLTGTNYTAGPCPDDPNQNAGFAYDADYYRLYIAGENIDLFFYVWITDVPKPNQENATGELLSVFASEVASLDGSLQLGENVIDHSISIVDENGMPLFTENTVIRDSLTILDRTFLNVIENNKMDLTPKYTVYYNLDFGIVGFKQEETGLEYVFDRFDN